LPLSTGFNQIRFHQIPLFLIFHYIGNFIYKINIVAKSLKKVKTDFNSRCNTASGNNTPRINNSMPIDFTFRSKLRQTLNWYNGFIGVTIFSVSGLDAIK